MAKELTEETFADTIANTEGISVVQYSAVWCGPCRMLTPRLTDLAKNLNLTYFKVDVDKNPELAKEFTIMSIPTLQWYKNGRLADTTVGVKSYGELRKIVEDL